MALLTAANAEASAEQALRPSPSCRFFLYDAPENTGVRLKTVRLVPPRWHHNQYAVEHYLHEACAHHPARCGRPDEADMIVVRANFSLWCFMGKESSERMLWQAMLEDRMLWPLNSSTAGPPKLVALQYGMCAPPWRGSRRPSDVFVLRDRLRHSATGRSERYSSFVSPFVVSEPRWLVDPAGAAQLPETPSWSARVKLLFFSGHVPKLSINPTRYRIWHQIKSDPRVTAFSHTLNCSVGSYLSTCKKLPLASRDHYLTFCHPQCGSASKCGMNPRQPLRVLHAELRRQCDAAAQHARASIGSASELADMARDTRRLEHEEYLSLAMAHRFCLVAPGDWSSTHKTTEAIALGAVGGCIPVFVVPSGATNSGRVPADQVQAMLPYTRWLDYCTIGLFVSEHVARRRFGGVVMRRLAQMSAADAAAKLRALKRVRGAFVFRGIAADGKASAMANVPSAADFIIAEACHLALRLRGKTGPARYATSNLSSCTLS